MYLPPPEVLGSLRALRRPLPSWAHDLAARSTSHAASWAGRCDVDDALATRLLLIAETTDATNPGSRGSFDNWFWQRDVVTTMYARRDLDLDALAANAQSPIISAAAEALLANELPTVPNNDIQAPDDVFVFKTFREVRFGKGVARTRAMNTVRKRGVSPVGLRALVAGFAAYQPSDKVLFDLAQMTQAHVDLNQCPEYLCDHQHAGHHGVGGDTEPGAGFCFIGLLATFNPATVNRLAPGALISVLDALNPDARDAAVRLLSTMDSTSRLSVADVATTAGLL